MTGKPDKAAEREWKGVLDEHANYTMQGIIHAAVSTRMGNARKGPGHNGNTVEIQGPDGVWRRYYVWLTCTGAVMP